MLVDTFGRTVDYLRISVTSQCNFSCSYCKSSSCQEEEKVLSFDELFFVIQIAIEEGIKKLRITGGEPLLRKDLASFIGRISKNYPHVEINLTTNGFFLKYMGLDLKNAGLHRANISLDTLDEEKFFLITKKRALSLVKDGIDEAIKHSLKLKLNTVVMRGINDDEILSLLDFARKKGIFIRFIEFMPTSHASFDAKRFSSTQILEVIAQKHRFEKIQKDILGPASLYKMQNGYVFGVIEPLSSDFCASCNRLRMMANGSFVPCLFYDDSLNIKEFAQKKDAPMVRKFLRKAVNQKPQKNLWQEGVVAQTKFFALGG